MDMSQVVQIRYFFEHPDGNWEITEATGDYAFLLGKSFYQGNSSTTASFYRRENAGKEYSSKVINNDFQFKIANSLISKAISTMLAINIFEIGINSSDGGLIDYKQYLSTQQLYLFNKTIYNQQEAGNILWGMTMAVYDLPLWEAYMGANTFALLKNLKQNAYFSFDEENEVNAFIKGYIYYKTNIKAQQAK